MSDLRFVEKLANAPWLCDASYLEFMHGLLVQHQARAAAGVPLDRRAIEQATGRPLDNTRQVTIRDGVARIPVDGPIFRHANIFTEISGAVSTGTLTKDFLAAHNDATVHSILFVFDTPGGEATGINELAGIIRQKRDEGTKRVEAYVDGLCASAGYWLASATSKITTDATGALGSIGVVTRVSNPESAGKSGTLEFWNSRSPKKRMDPKSYEGQSAIQGYVDDLGDEFIRAVADNRGVSEEEVVKDFGEGFVVVGRRAVEVGLADALGSEEGVVASLVARERDPTLREPAAPAAAGTGLTINEDRLRAFANGDEEAPIMTEQATGQPAVPEGEESARGIVAGIRRLLGGAVVDAAAQDAEPPGADTDWATPRNNAAVSSRQSTDDGSPPSGGEGDPSGESEVEETEDDQREETDEAMTETRTEEVRDTDQERSDATANTGGAITREELENIKAELAAEREANARNTAALRERGIEAMLSKVASVELEDGKTGVMPPAQRRAAKTLISTLAEAGADAVVVSASGAADLADNDAGKALGDLLTPWRPQEVGERGTASGEGPEDPDGETPEGEIQALMDKEGISYREAAVRLSSKGVN